MDFKSVPWDVFAPNIHSLAQIGLGVLDLICPYLLAMMKKAVIQTFLTEVSLICETKRVSRSASRSNEN